MAQTTTILTSLFLTVCLTCTAQTDAPAGTSKWNYALFRPTPRTQMRPWQTDQAGNSPYTTDAGHLEAATTLASFERSTYKLSPWYSDSLDSWSFGATTLKVGLLNNLDFEVLVPSYTIVNFKQTYQGTFNGTNITFKGTASGFGSLATRVKLNLYGNDSGPVAIAVSGLAIYPTAELTAHPPLNNGLAARDYEPGAEIEFQSRLPWNFDLRLNSGFIGYRDGYQTSHSLSLSHPIAENLSAYLMFSAHTYPGWYDLDGDVHLGAKYRVSDQVELFGSIRWNVLDPYSDFDRHEVSYGYYDVSIGVSTRF